MTKPYFANFPKMYYNGKITVNTTLRAHLLKQVIDNYSAFYPYIIHGNPRPDEIAEKYYGSPDYVWLVYFSLELIDPYYQWPMSDEQFLNYITNKYGSVALSQTTIVHYVYNAHNDPTDIEKDYRSNYTMDPNTFQFLSSPAKGYWNPVYAFDYENQLNDDRRTIRLIDNDLVVPIENEFRKIMNG